MNRRRAAIVTVTLSVCLMAIVAGRAMSPSVVIDLPAHDLRDVWPASTFKTGALIVDTSSYMNSTGSATAHIGIGSGVAPPYSGSAASWWINTSTDASDALIIDDTVSGHTENFNTVTIHNSGTFDVTGSDKLAIGLRIVMDPLPAGVGHILNNAGLTIDTNNGDTNLAIHVIHGTTQIDEDINTGPLSSSTVHSIGNFDVNTSMFTVDAATGNTLTPGLLTLSNTVESIWTKGRSYFGGTTKGDTVYISGGSVNFGSENNAPDTLHINFTGYHGAFSQTRNLEVDDGTGNPAATFNGATHALAVVGAGSFGGTLNMTTHAITGVTDLTTTGNTILGDSSADTLTVNATPTFNTTVSITGALNVTGNLKFGADNQILSGGAPSVNHGALSTGSTNFSGDVTGIGANTSIDLTYSAAFSTRSRCIATPLNATVTVEQITATTSASGVTFSCIAVTTGSAANCDDFTYQCVGQ